MADVAYFEEDDGLRQSWSPGPTLCNPPYRLMRKFVCKLLAEIAIGNARPAILVCQPRTDTDWFKQARAKASCICHCKRIKFWNPHKPKSQSPREGIVFMYFGKYVKRFKMACKPVAQFFEPE
jgi:hypothetical protein